MAATATSEDELDVDADHTLTWYLAAPGTRYGFCGRCGATLFWRVDDRPDHVSIAAGTLDPPTGLHTDSALFVAEHGDYHAREPAVTEWPGDQTSPPGG